MRSLKSTIHNIRNEINSHEKSIDKFINANFISEWNKEIDRNKETFRIQMKRTNMIIAIVLSYAAVLIRTNELIKYKVSLTFLADFVIIIYIFFRCFFFFLKNFCETLVNKISWFIENTFNRINYIIPVRVDEP